MYYNTYIIKNNKFNLTTYNQHIRDYVDYNFNIDNYKLNNSKLYHDVSDYSETLNENITYNTEELNELISKCNSIPDLKDNATYGGKNKKIKKLKKY